MLRSLENERRSRRLRRRLSRLRPRSPENRRRSGEIRRWSPEMRRRSPDDRRRFSGLRTPTSRLRWASSSHRRGGPSLGVGISRLTARSVENRVRSSRLRGRNAEYRRGFSSLGVMISWAIVMVSAIRSMFVGDSSRSSWVHASSAKNRTQSGAVITMFVRDHARFAKNLTVSEALPSSLGANRFLVHGWCRDPRGLWVCPLPASHVRAHRA